MLAALFTAAVAAGVTLNPAVGSASVPAAAQKPAPKKPVQKKAKVVQITIDKVAFGSMPAGIAVGDTIEWVNNDIFDHTATARNNAWDVTIPAGKKVRVVMKKAGVFEYYCKYHPNMTGTVTVKKAS